MTKVKVIANEQGAFIKVPGLSSEITLTVPKSLLYDEEGNYNDDELESECLRQLCGDSSFLEITDIQEIPPTYRTYMDGKCAFKVKYKVQP